MANFFIIAHTVLSFQSRVIVYYDASYHCTYKKIMHLVDYIKRILLITLHCKLQVVFVSLG